MAKHEEEWEAIKEALSRYDANTTGETSSVVFAQAGKVLAERVNMALKGTIWTRVKEGD